jgi:hypothetical protein
MQSLSTLIGRDPFPRVRVSKMNSARHCRLTVSVVSLFIMGWTWVHFFPHARPACKYERQSNTTSLAVRDAAFLQSRPRESRFVIKRRIPESGK